MKTVYLLHFIPRYRHAGHYLGFTKVKLEIRIEQHRAGHGARLTQVAVAAGCKLVLARVWKNQGRTYERHLKNKGGKARFCPVCRGEKEVAV